MAMVSKPQKAENVKKVMSEVRRVVEARYRIARATYDAQDNLTKEVLDRIVDRLRIAATGVIAVNGKPFKLEQELQDFNLLFIATEILSDLALNNIQVANFEPNPAYCIECKREITSLPKKRKRVYR